ncbi:MAG: hypothetical protein HY791_19625 [Deltaproteobacteria bacterium]|nr:hypothetical protein [Deltaproteobacteria bacterium]
MKGRRTPKWVTLTASSMLALSACGQRTDASLSLPEPREARVGLVAALDLGGLSSELSGRVTVEEISVNVDVLRLLGDNPAIPTGGHPLVEGPHLLSSREGEALFPFPEAYVQGGLAVFGRVGPTEALDGASVVIRGRVSGPTVTDEKGVTHRESPLEPGPDGEPAKDPCEPGPDGEPAKDVREPGPDGEPARPDWWYRIACDRDALRAQASVPFELRGSDSVDLVVELSETSRLHVVLGIPADRWLTAQLVKSWDAPESTPSADPSATQARVVVDVSEPAGLGSGESIPAEIQDPEGYRLLDEREFDPNQFRW